MRDAEAILTAVRDFIAREDLFHPDHRILVAGSGGLDSTVLACLLHELGFSIALAHGNYHLRGQDSDDDAAGVASLATQLGIRFFLLDAPLPSSHESTPNIQLWARQVRYNHFKKILDEYNYDVLVTGHHLDDNLFLNLLRGMGATGARGMPVRAHLPFPVARPLLELTRAELLRYATDRRLLWREDASNAGNAYRRNRLRHGVIPSLREEGLHDDSLRQTFRHLRSASRLADLALEQHPAVVRRGDRIILEKALLPSHPDDQLSLLWHYAAPRQFTRDQCLQLLTARRNLILRAPGYEARANGSVIELRTYIPADREILTIDRLPAEVVYQGDTYFFTRKAPTEPVTPDEVLRCRVPELPLHLRPRQPGDRIELPGMTGHRKRVKELLIDAKVPAWDRERVPVLTDAAGALLAVIGLRVSEGLLLTGGEAAVLVVRRQMKSPGKAFLSGA